MLGACDRSLPNRHTGAVTDSRQHTEPRQHTGPGIERKQQLLRAAEELFTQRGYGATRISDICAAAGVAKGLFYWYFPTKESLFAELVRTMRLALRRAQAAAMSPDADPVTRICQGAEASVRFMAEHQPYFALLDVERTDDALATVLQQGSDVYADDVRRLVVEAQQAGLMHDGDPDFFTIGILGAVSSFSNAHRRGRLDMSIDELAPLVGDWVRQATSGRAPTPTTDRGAASPG
jgi:AcrR family transcriptional regulator